MQLAIILKFSDKQDRKTARQRHVIKVDPRCTSEV